MHGHNGVHSGPCHLTDDDDDDVVVAAVSPPLSPPPLRPLVSYVTTSMNRLWQLRQTLASNIKLEQFSRSEFVVVNFGGKDKIEMNNFIAGSFREELLSGKLRYFVRLENWDRFHMSRAKNVAHRLARGDIIFSLDGDNLLTAGVDDSDTLLRRVLRPVHAHPSMYHTCNGPSFVFNRHFMTREASAVLTSSDAFDERVATSIDVTSEQKKPLWDGTSGRLAMTRETFHMLNGYDEAMTGMGYEEIDFIVRGLLFNGTYRHAPNCGASAFIPQRPSSDKGATKPLPELLANRKTFMRNIASSKIRVNEDGFLDDVESDFVLFNVRTMTRFCLDGVDFTDRTAYGAHRFGWNYAVQAFSVLANNKANGLFIEPFCERRFAWKTHESENSNSARSGRTKNNKASTLLRPWVGFVHNPFDSTQLPAHFVSPEYGIVTQILHENRVFRQSLVHCSALFVLAPSKVDFLTDALAAARLDAVQMPAVHAVLHPTGNMPSPWSFEAYKAQRSLVHVGSWLRKFSSFLRLRVPENVHKQMVSPFPHWSRDHSLVWKDVMHDETQRHSPPLRACPSSDDDNDRDSHVATAPFLGHENLLQRWNVEPVERLDDVSYDKLMCRSVLFLDVYESSANNVLVECIQNAIPILISRQHAFGCGDYVDTTYPLWFDSPRDAFEKLSDDTLIFDAHVHLKRLHHSKQLHLQTFVHSFLTSIDETLRNTTEEDDADDNDKQLLRRCEALHAQSLQEEAEENSRPSGKQENVSTRASQSPHPRFQHRRTRFQHRHLRIRNRRGVDVHRRSYRHRRMSKRNDLAENHV